MTVVIKQIELENGYVVELIATRNHYEVVKFDEFGRVDKSMIYGPDELKKATATYNRYARKAN
jgi:hypothetical protein